MDSIKSAVHSLTSGGSHPKAGDFDANSTAPAQDPQVTDRSPAEMPSTEEGLKEPKNLVTEDENGGSTNSRPDRGPASAPVSGGSDQQQKDPAVIEDNSKSTSGEGVDGSHSAVFGLTPDGHKHDDTSHGHGSLQPAHSEEVSNTGGD